MLLAKKPLALFARRNTNDQKTQPKLHNLKGPDTNIPQNYISSTGR